MTGSDRIGFCSEEDITPVSMTIGHHRTHFRTIENDEFPVVNKEYAFDPTPFPAAFSIAVSISDGMNECLLFGMTLSSSLARGVARVLSIRQEYVGINKAWLKISSKLTRILFIKILLSLLFILANLTIFVRLHIFVFQVKVVDGGQRDQVKWQGI